MYPFVLVDRILPTPVSPPPPPPEVAADVADSLRDLLPEGVEPHIARYGSALGVCASPGAIGIALLQAED